MGITYTQHTVAWRHMPVDIRADWHVDKVGVSLDDGDEHEGTLGEINWTFMHFNNQGGAKGVHMEFFGDGRRCFFDSRIQEAIKTWLDVQ